MLERALLAALAYFICYGGNWLFGQCMIERPIVVGAVTGFLLGDLKAGIMMGAALEAIFMGAVNIGGQISAEPAAATVFAVVFATTQGINADAALAIAIPIGVLSAFVSMFMNNILLNAFVPIFDRMAEKNDVRGLVAVHYGTWLLRFGVFSIILFVGVLVGNGPLTVFVENIPNVVMRGLTATGGFLPAVGFAILLKMLWSKELAVYFLLGFVSVSYLKLPLIAVAAFAIVIVVVNGMRDMQLINITNSRVATKTESSELEDFLK